MRVSGSYCRLETYEFKNPNIEQMAQTLLQLYVELMKREEKKKENVRKRNTKAL